MKLIIPLLAVFSSFLFSHSKPVNIMLITGGHSFDTVQFFQMFDALEDVEYTHFPQPEANRTIAGGEAANYDLLVFYDMWNEISENEKTAYVELTKLGKPMLFLHHSLVSYQEWPLFEKIIGGKYIEKRKGIPSEELSIYEHDIWVYAEPAGNHPVTHGLGSMSFFDEIYGNYRISENVIPVLTTSNPKSEKVIGWENRFNNSVIIYLQPGHDYRTYENKDYRKLIRQAINYLKATK